MLDNFLYFFQLYNLPTSVHKHITMMVFTTLLLGQQTMWAVFSLGHFRTMAFRRRNFFIEINCVFMLYFWSGRYFIKTFLF